MAQSGFTPIQLYYSTTPSSTPTAGNLVPGELAINTADGKLFYEDSGGVVQVIATKAGASGDVVGPASATDGNLAAFDGTTGKLIKQAATVTAAQGGTGQSTYTTGDLLYATGASALSKLGIGASTTILTSSGSAPQWTTASSVAIGTATNLAGGTGGSLPYQSGAGATTFLGIGTNGQILTSTGTAPQWSTLSGVAVTTFSAGTTGFTPSTATSGAVTLAGTLATTNGGTGLTSFTANRVFYASSTSAIGQSANLTFDGTTLTAAGFSGPLNGSVGASTPSTGAFTTLSASSTVTFSGGTANGVLYLDGSKVATSGSALTFDGTTLTAARYLSTSSNAALPSYGVEAGSGIFNAGASTIGFSVGSSEQMRLTSTGLGIGTSSPSVRLTVAGSAKIGLGAASNSATLMVNNLSGSATGVQLFQDAQESWIMEVPASSTGLRWTASGTEYMRLTNAGNLGIGTSSPGAKLDVRSAIGTSVDATPQNILAMDTTAYAQGNGGGISFGYVYNSGGLTINRAAVIKGIKENATDGNYAAALTFSTTANSASTTEKMRLDSSGNLGLGVVPSAWGTSAFQTKVASVWGFSNNAYVGCNYYFDGTDRRYIATAAASEYAQFNGQHTWYNAPSGTAGNAISFTQAMTLHASGGLSVGNTGDPSAYALSVGPRDTSNNDAVIRIDGGSGVSGEAILVLARNGASNLLLVSDGSINEVRGVTNVPLAFRTNDTERARITSGGDLLVGTTSATFTGTRVEVLADTNQSGLGAKVTQTAYTPLSAWNADTTGNNSFMYFYTEATATSRGSITYNRAGGLTAYNTTSDYRSKDIIGPVQNPGATIDALKVYEGVMKGATQSRPMLIAHEAQVVAPYAVSGVKDEVNEDGTPKFQQIDVSSLVPLLLAEIQSLRARVAALESQP